MIDASSSVVGPWFWPATAALFGLCIGSFLNVVIARLPSGESLVRPGSRCPVCKMPIAPWDNVPVLSYLLLGGRCRHCKAKISPRYPMVELLAAVLSAAVVAVHPNRLQAASYLLLCYGLLAASFIDLDTRVIPNEITFPGMVLGLALSLFPGGVSPLDSLLGLVLGGGILLGLIFLYLVLRGIEGMGFGDVKLMAVIGAFLGVSGVAVTLLVGSTTAVLVSLVLAASGRLKPEAPKVASGAKAKPSLKYASLPFGPFLSIGAMSHVLFGRIILQALAGIAA